MSSLRCPFVIVIIAALSLSLIGSAFAADTAEVGLCRNDLAKRLKVKLSDVTLVTAKPATFTDGSLGFPRPGEVYTKAIESGFFIILRCKNSQYLYAAAGKTVRYGGPADAREYSALYLEPVEDEPNLNGNLMQLALAGDNPVLMLEGVSDFRPQPDGSIIAKRRTSRSGHVLLYLAPGKREQAVPLMGAFDFTDAAVSNDGKRWAAISRPMVGAAWVLVTGAVPEKPQGEPVALPAGRPDRVYLHMGNPVVRMMQDGLAKYFELADGAFKPVSFFPPPTEEMMLNKSETLVIESIEINGKPVTRVLSEWFTGQQTSLATIQDFKLGECWLTPNKQFALLYGARGDERLAYTVDTQTGEVLQTLADAPSPVRLLLAPSASPIVMRP